MATKTGTIALTSRTLYWRMSISETSYNAANNTSTLSYSFEYYMSAGSGGWNDGNSIMFQLGVNDYKNIDNLFYVNGVEQSSITSGKTYTNSTKTMKVNYLGGGSTYRTMKYCPPGQSGENADVLGQSSGTFTISHNADGTGTAYLQARFGMYGTGAAATNGSIKTMTSDTITLTDLRRTVSYSSSGASSGSAPASQQKTIGTALTLASNSGNLAKSSTSHSNNRTGQAITLSYNANGGSGAPSANTGTGVTVPGSFTRTYSFSGWATSSGGAKVYNAGGSYTTDSDITLYPAFSYSDGGTSYTATSASATISSTKPTKANTDTNVTITVSYNANGGSGAPSVSTGTAVNTTPHPFSQWAAGSTSGTKYNAGATYTENITASKTVTMYAIYGDGTTTRKSNPSITLSSTKPTRTGYTFKGWATSNTATTASYEAGKAYTFNANTTLYAVWQLNSYTVTLNANGGTGGSTSVTIAYGTTKGNYPSITKPTKTGYTFTGFYSATSGGTQWYDANGSSVRTFDLTSNTTWYAQWTINSYYLDLNCVIESTTIGAYDYSGDLTGHGTADVTVNGTLVANDVTDYWVAHPYGSTYAISDVKCVAGWQYDGVASDSPSPLSGTIGVGGANVWVVMARKVVKVTLDNQSAESAGTTAYYFKYGATKSIGSTTYYYFTNNSFTTGVGSVTIPQKFGYTFGGYYTAPNGGGTAYVRYDGAFINNIYSSVTDNITLYAYWMPITFYLTYDANGGTDAPATQAFVFNAGEKISTSIPSRSGYTFVDWVYNGIYHFNPGDTIPNGWGNFTLVAQWTPNTYTITYDANGGTGAPSQTTYTTAAGTVISSTIPSKTGYTFVDWTYLDWYHFNPGGAVPADWYGDITIVAQWQINTYSVSYDVGDATSGTAPNAQTKTYGQNLTLATNSGGLSHSSTKRAGTKEITVSYDANGGSSTPASGKRTVGTETVVYWSAIGWSTTSGSLTKNYDFGGTYTANAAATLYPAWSNMDGSTTVTEYVVIKMAGEISRENEYNLGYKVTYNANEGSGAPNQQLTNDRLITYSFMEWNSASDGSGSGYIPSMGYWCGRDLQLYAIWNKTEYTDSLWRVSAIIPSRTGYEFLGWSEDPNAEEPTYLPNEEYTITSTLEVYAVWKKLGSIRVCIDREFKYGRPHVWINGSYYAGTAYVYTGSTWKKGV